MHTPGPWEMIEIEESGSLEVIAPNVDLSEGHRVCSVHEEWEYDYVRCQVPGGLLPRAQVDANARLIAAAPDLLDAIKTLLAIVAREYTSRPATLDWDMARALTAARTAIDKAEGDTVEVVQDKVDRDNREDRALGALIVLALRGDGDGDLPPLTTREREALDSLGPDFIDRLTRRTTK